MIKRLAYIVLLLIFATGLSSAKIKADPAGLANSIALHYFVSSSLQKDTIKKLQPDEDQKKIKEISKAKKQVKPEKLGMPDGASETKGLPKPRQRRPEGLDRPPEIPRRNGN